MQKKIRMELTEMRRRRRRYRDAEGIERVGIGEVVCPSQPTRGSGERRELHQPRARLSPASNKRLFRTFCLLSVTERF